MVWTRHPNAYQEPPPRANRHTLHGKATGQGIIVTPISLKSAVLAAYVAKKAASPAPVKITAVSPQKGPATATVKIFGSGFGNATSGNAGAPNVTLGGLA